MGKILCSTHQKKCFYKLLGSFWKIEFLTENRQPRTLQKWWKFCTISKWAKNFFSCKILCCTHQKKWFYKLLGSFWKFEFLTENRQPRTLQKWWKFCTISKCAKNFFSCKILCCTHQKKWFYKLLGSFWKFEFLTENRQPRTLQKWWKFCTISKCAKKIFFGKILCCTHQKKCFYKLLGSFWKIEFLTENRQPRTLQKWWKFCTISKCAKKIFFGKILCCTHQKKCFYKLLGSFWKIEFLTENRQPRTLQKWWKFCTISKCAKKIFFGKILCSTHQKKCFYKLLGSFWKIEFLTENRQPRTLQKWWKFCTISKWAKNFFSAKILCSTHQKKFFYKLLGSFWKIEFLTENRQPRTLQKWWKFCTISKWAKNFFSGKILCSTHQKKWFYKLLGSFWKFEFLTENRQPRTLQKWWKFCTISKSAKKIFFGKILCSTHQKKCFYKLLGSFWKIEFLTEKWQPGTLKKWWKFCTISKCAKKTFFCKILCFTHQKKCFYKLLGSFWKIEILTENRQPRTLQKWWKFCTISKWAKNFFSAKILCSTHQKKCFYKLLGSFFENWIFDGKMTAADLTKMVKILYYLKMC